MKTTTKTTTSLYSVETDALAVRAARGDSAALAELYAAHQDTVLALVAARLRGAARADIEDAAQDVWVDVCEQIWTFVPTYRPFGRWVEYLVKQAAERIQPQPEVRPRRLACPLRVAAVRMAVAA